MASDAVGGNTETEAESQNAAAEIEVRELATDTDLALLSYQAYFPSGTALPARLSAEGYRSLLDADGAVTLKIPGRTITFYDSLLGAEVVRNIPERLAAQAFTNPAGEIVVAFAGTRNWYDIAGPDLWVALDLLLPEYRKALDFVQRIQREHPGRSIILTGHSFGGADAQYVASRLSSVRAVTFGAPGIKTALENAGLNASGNVRNYVDPADEIGGFDKHVGEDKFVGPSETDGVVEFFIGPHGSSTYARALGATPGDLDRGTGGKVPDADPLPRRWFLRNPHMLPMNWRGEPPSPSYSRSAEAPEEISGQRFSWQLDRLAPLHAAGIEDAATDEGVETSPLFTPEPLAVAHSLPLDRERSSMAAISPPPPTALPYVLPLERGRRSSIPAAPRPGSRSGSGGGRDAGSSEPPLGQAMEGAFALLAEKMDGLGEAAAKRRPQSPRARKREIIGIVSEWLEREANKPRNMSWRYDFRRTYTPPGPVPPM